ncbi:hypothetical protein ACH42_17390 [Endozoicomonas sp. (ex Bugula neritina AB1)]|nr:hypothetical protein ACH42_17390 [Endozoicomonas sp. (ex Bugula neritina AB1)]
MAGFIYLNAPLRNMITDLIILMFLPLIHEGKPVLFSTYSQQTQFALSVGALLKVAGSVVEMPSGVRVNLRMSCLRDTYQHLMRTEPYCGLGGFFHRDLRIIERSMVSYLDFMR